MSRPLEAAAFNLAPWRKDVIVLRGGTHQELARFVRSYGIKYDADNTSIHGHAFLYEGKPAIVWVQTWPGSAEDYGVLAHELYHVTKHTLESRGLRHTNATEEAYAYTLQNLVTTALAYRRWRAAFNKRSRRRALALVKAA
jgi:hypothetical protein